MAKGSKMLQYKEVLNRLETESPGTKQMFYWEFSREAKQEAAHCQPPWRRKETCPSSTPAPRVASPPPPWSAPTAR